MRALELRSAGQLLIEIDVDLRAPGGDEVQIRVEAAGICHSDVHYRAGLRPLDTLPVVLGHETAGVIVGVGEHVSSARVGERVAVHYVVSCGVCSRCVRSGEQFCENYDMVGVTVAGGFAEMVNVPARNAIAVPEAIPTEHAAVMMCSSATALHALHKARLQPGETVAIFGVGGLGMSGVQLAIALGAGHVIAVDIDEERLSIASDLGAHAVDAEVAEDVIASVGGTDVALDLVGSFDVLRVAIDGTAPRGRVVSVGLTNGEMPLDPFADLIKREVELIGSNDHLESDIHELFAIASSGGLTLDQVVTGQISLDVAAVNAVMDVMESYGPGIRTVIVPDA